MNMRNELMRARVGVTAAVEVGILKMGLADRSAEGYGGERGGTEGYK